MDNPVLQKILENSFTLSQCKHRVRILREYISYKLFSKEEEAAKQDPSDSEWLNSLGNSFFSQFNRSNFDQIFADLENYLKKARPLIIYLAFNPSDELVSQIGLYLRKNSQHQIFDLKVDPNLVAGAALSYNGIYKDYSLRAKIGFEKEKILANFKRFLT